MNFVIFSYSFPPRNGPECFCTARFASSLARLGHHVHVVTMDHAKNVSDDVYNFLVDKSIVVTRVPLAERSRRKWASLRYLLPNFESKDITRARETLRTILQKYESPILISRSNPIVSNIVAWHCRKYAGKWVAHFSDPIPFSVGPERGIMGYLRWKMVVTWCRRIIRSADIISVTCPEVFRFYREVYGREFERAHKIVVPHIGNPVLPTFARKSGLPVNGKLVVHSGSLGLGRGPGEIQASISRLNKANVQCHFVQVGELPGMFEDAYRRDENITIASDLSPELSEGLSEMADVVLISDEQVPWGYVPFMPSKFVYRLFSDKPIVAYTRVGSPMYRVATEYPNCGIFVADSQNPETLDSAIRLAVECDGVFPDRGRARQMFTRETVARDFVASLTV